MLLSLCNAAGAMHKEATSQGTVWEPIRSALPKGRESHPQHNQLLRKYAAAHFKKRLFQQEIGCGCEKANQENTKKEVKERIGNQLCP
jgi:hypothetical protein